MLKKYFFFYLFIFCSSLSRAQFEVPPTEKFKVLENGIFEVIYNAKQQELGQFYLGKLLEAERILRPHFEFFPEKIRVIIVDKTDMTNGYATRIPYPHLMIYPVLPGPTESLADYGDWILEFLVHELVHILNFEPATGLAKYLRPLFGNILAPNILLPQWWKEGLAVYYESLAAGKGRLHSPLQDAQIRAWVLEKSLSNYDLAEINEALPSWPRGMRPYLFGSLFWAHLIEEKGTLIADQLNQRHGGRAPYFLNGAAEDLTAQTYETIYADAIAKTEARALEQIQILKKEPPTTHETFSSQSMLSYLPAISKDGSRIAFIGTDRRERRFLKVFEKENGVFKESRSALELRNDENDMIQNRHEAPDSGSIQRITWFHQTRKMIYDKIDAVNSIERFTDLYIYDFDAKKTQRLTNSGRAREATVAPSDSRIAYIDTANGRTQLMLMTLPSKTLKVLITSDFGERISTPVFLDEDHLIFAKRQSPGKESLFQYSILTDKLTAVVASGENSRYPSVHGEKLFYLSAKNGAYNIYSVAIEDLENRSRHKPLTHSLTSITSFSFDSESQKLYFTEVSAQGPQIKSLVLQNSLPDQLPKIENLFTAKNLLPPSEDMPSQTDFLNTEHQEYRPISYLLPQYWIPFAATSSTTGGLVLQATTSGFDPLKKHNYAGTLSYDTILGEVSFAGQYLNTQNKIPFLLLASEVNSFLGDVENTVVDQNAQVSLLPDIWSWNRYSSLQLSWRYNSRSVQASEIKRSGPSIFANYIHVTKGGDQISPAEGKSLYAGFTQYLPGSGQLEHSQYLLGGTYYSDALLPEGHAWMLRANVSHIPEKISDIYGAQTESFTLDSNTLAPSYLMRGLTSGEIFGRTLAVVNAEYRFPLRRIDSGNGTRPYFWRELWGAFVVDAAATQGRVLSMKELRYVRMDLDRIFVSYGGELHLETTLGYLFPMGFVLGYFYTPEAYDGPQTAFRLSLQFSL